jgi:hypothetical protein
MSGFRAWLLDFQTAFTYIPFVGNLFWKLLGHHFVDGDAFSLPSMPATCSLDTLARSEGCAMTLTHSASGTTFQVPSSQSECYSACSVCHSRAVAGCGGLVP